MVGLVLAGGTGGNLCQKGVGDLMMIYMRQVHIGQIRNVRKSHCVHDASGQARHGLYAGGTLSYSLLGALT